MNTSRRSTALVLSMLLGVAACDDDPVAPAGELRVETELESYGLGQAIAVLAVNGSDETVWFTCTNPRLVVERRDESGDWIEYRRLDGGLCSITGPIGLTPGQDLLQFAHIGEPGEYRFGVAIQSEPDVEAAGEMVFSGAVPVLKADTATIVK